MLGKFFPLVLFFLSVNALGIPLCAGLASHSGSNDPITVGRVQQAIDSAMQSYSEAKQGKKPFQWSNSVPGKIATSYLSHNAENMLSIESTGDLEIEFTKVSEYEWGEIYSSAYSLYPAGIDWTQGSLRIRPRVILGTYSWHELEDIILMCLFKIHPVPT